MNEQYSYKPIALVTGAYRGLGRETVKQLAEKGYRTVLTGRKPGKGRTSAEKLAGGGLDVLYHNLDVTDEKSISSVASYLDETFGRLDVLVNNAAVHYDEGNSAADPDWAIVRQAADTNFIAPWKVSAALIPLIRESEHGRIVNVSSGSGSLHAAPHGTPAYSATKAALNMLTVEMAAELRPAGIKVNAVCPGWVRTDMGGPAAPRSVEKGAKGIVWAATLPDDGPTGGFYRDGKAIKW